MIGQFTMDVKFYIDANAKINISDELISNVINVKDSCNVINENKSEYTHIINTLPDDCLG